MRRNFLAVFVLFAGSLMVACSSDNKNAKIEVWLTDAPGDYQQVNVDVQGVEIHSEDGNQQNGWVVLNIKKGIYNLLELTNGLDTLLGTIEIPSGKISQIRLKLGENNTLKTNNQMVNLSVPSGQQSGLKLQVHQTLEEGITYKILLDFDVARSIVQTGNLSYKLKPVIRTITEAQNGAIKGMVSPKESTPAIYAINGTDTLATTFSDESGAFLLRGLAAGSYKVTFVPKAGYIPTAKENVNVTVGNVTDLGTVTINQ